MNQPSMHYVSKGWGFERWIVNNEKYCGKLLYIVKDKCCSFHFHKEKDETFYLQSGKILLRYSDNFQEIEKILPVAGKTWKDFVSTVILKPGDNFHIPPGRVHQMVALRDSELFEFSTQHFESDSYRIIKGD